MTAPRTDPPTRAQIEQAFIDGSIEGSPIDHDGVRLADALETEWLNGNISASARDRLAGLPVREDEPTGIDGLREAYAAYARSADGAGSVQSAVVQRLVEAVYDRLTREASHVR